MLFEKLEQALQFVKKKKINKFSFETEEGNFFFLGVKISREKDKLPTSILRKDTLSCVYTNFSSFVALKHKFGLVHTLLHRSFTTVSDFSKFHLKLKHLRKHFIKMLIQQNLLTNV